MKKNISFFIASLLVLHSLVACTLSMDEWIESDENKGYSDIATEKNGRTRQTLWRRAYGC